MPLGPQWSTRDLVRGSRLRGEAQAASRQFRRHQDRAALDEARWRYRDVVRLLPAGLSVGLDARRELVRLLVLAIEQYPDDAEYSAHLLEILKELADLPGISKARRAGWLALSGTHFVQRFEVTGNTDELDSSVQDLRLAINLLQGRWISPLRIVATTTLGAVLATRGAFCSSQADVDEGIHHLHSSLRSARYFPRMRVQIGIELVRAHNERFYVIGDDRDLERAISGGRRVARTARRVEDRLFAHHNLAIALTYRFGFRGELADLDEALCLSHDTVEGTPEGHLQSDVRLRLHASLLSNHAAQSADAQALDEVIAIGRRSVSDVEPGPDLSGLQANLAANLAGRYTRDRAPADREEARALLVEAITNVAAGTPDALRYAADLLFLHGDADDVTQDEQWIHDLHGPESALQAGISPDNADYCRQLVALATCARLRWRRSHQESDATVAIERYEAAAGTLTGPGVYRLEAAVGAAEIQAEAGLWPSAAHSYALALELVDAVLWRGLSRRSHHAAAGRLQGLGRAAAAAAIMSGSGPDTVAQGEAALAYLEMGRGIYWRQQLELRSRIDTLLDPHPDLHRKLMQVRTRLDHERALP